MKPTTAINIPSKKERHKLFGSVEPGIKTKPDQKEDMADLQNERKDYLFTINRVGVNKVKYPITVKSDLAPNTQSTIGTFQLASQIGRDSKGTNMSRFIEQLESFQAEGSSIDFPSLQRFIENLSEHLDKEQVSLEVSFPWFYQASGPKSEKSALNHGDVTIRMTQREDGSLQIEGRLEVYVTTLCPCSKEISEYSAHSQRGKVTMDVQFMSGFEHSLLDWKKELLNAAESNASSMIYPLLKRVDEKHVTETAYENPRFVEDMVRLVAADLYEMPYIQSFHVSCENEESIHLHNAIAEIEFDKESEGE
ncbi:MAG TPA: GTP cyclohydrolase FolE2 [Pseudogracilibacillus sp.]|nr:GTP cyclohydrolase FolE2 [Pseudogracilibacillus sp.]